MKKEPINSIFILPSEGILILNGEKKPNVSSFILEFTGGKWELSLTEGQYYEAKVPIGGVRE